jgi:hypothetical protein
MIHAMVWSLVLTSGARTSRSGLIKSMISAVERSLLQFCGREKLGSQMTPPLPSHRARNGCRPWPARGQWSAAHGNR